MRFHVVSLVPLGLLVFSSLGLPQSASKPPLDGSRNDDHGNIYWKSTANSEYGASDVLWVYDRIVENRDGKRKCHVNWEPAQWAGTVDPGQTKLVGHSKTALYPIQRDGDVLYNGGSAAGDGPPAPAPVWDPVQPKKASFINSEGLIAFEMRDFSYRGQIISSSSFKQNEGGKTYELSYVLQMSNELPSEVRLRWDSVESQEWNNKVGRENVQQGKYIQFKSGKFSISLTTNRSPVFKNGSIRFLDGNNRLLARVWLPAFAPAS